MDPIAHIQSLVQEAELYRTQGLLREAQVRYGKVMTLLQQQPGIRNRQGLMEKLQAKLAGLEAQIAKLDSEPVTPQMSKETQDLIRKLFTDSKNSDSEAQSLEGAIVMAKFGQFDRALHEFDLLIAKDTMRVVAAKNILRCHLAAGMHAEAVHQYEKWFLRDDFPAPQLEKIRVFLTDLLEKKGQSIALAPRALPESAQPPAAVSGSADLPTPRGQHAAIPTAPVIAPPPLQPPKAAAARPEPVLPKTAEAAPVVSPRSEADAPHRPFTAPPLATAPAPDRPALSKPAPTPNRPALSKPAPAPISGHASDGETEEDMLDINAVLIGFSEGPLQGKKVELDVSFRSRNVVSLMIPGSEGDLIASLPVGRALADVQFFSPIAIFQGRGRVTGCTRIESGPRRGSVNIDLEVTSA